ncbi:MAG: hypothetical protein OHK0046_01260 [Anaerolineae bacterium]
MTTSPQAKIPTESLPLWMQQARQRVDWGILLAICLALVIAHPFWLRESLPSTNATENYVFRAAETALALREGRLYPRWSAAAMGGYGAPIPNYEPPGAPYTAALIEVLFTNDTLLAVRVVYMLAFALAGAMTYAFVTRLWGAGAGVLASVLYVYSPYLGLTAPHVLGDLPGVLAYGLLPGLLWAMHRLLHRNQPFDFLVMPLFMAALILTEPRVAAAGGAFALLYALWYTAQQRRYVARVVLALGAGMALASFYWLPAWIEQDAVRWVAQAIIPLSFAPVLPDVLLPLRLADLNELVPRPHYTLGLSGGLALVVSIVMLILDRARRGLTGLFVVSGVLLLGAAVLMEQSWLLGAITLCFSITASALIPWSERLNLPWQRLVLPLALMLVLAFSIPVWLPPAGASLSTGISLYDQILYERQGYGVAVLPPGAEVPATLPDVITDDRVLVEGYRTGNPIRLPESQLAMGRQASLMQSSTHSDYYMLKLDKSTVFDILRAPFPGWQAQLNGSPVILDTDPATGLLEVRLPTVENGNLFIRLQSTPIRRFAWGITWVTLFLLILGVTQRLRRTLEPGYPAYARLLLLTNAEARLVSVIFVGFTAAVLTFGNTFSPVTLYPRPGAGLDNTIGVRARTGAGLEVLSYELPGRVFTLGDDLELMLAWRTVRPLVQNYQVHVFLQDTALNARWLEDEPRTIGAYPTRRWLPNRYVRDFYHLRLPSQLRPGTYRLAVEVYLCEVVCQPGDRQNFFDASGQFLGPTLLLPPIITLRR